ncbi:MAG: carbonic anhydrase [Parachlamydia sp.]|jgi:carbonic anhydrase|nr:carbonic anhydrase [Parachlamydia sp.]
MKNLVEGIVEFRKNLTDDYRRLFAQLALGHKPDVLFIACCDSRVVPNLFASTNPGDLFVLRNIGNMVPPLSAQAENSPLAALEFATHSLQVKDIVICGHSECGAMQAIIEGVDERSSPHLAAWLQWGVHSYTRLKEKGAIDKELSPHNQLSQMNVLQQMDHLRSHAFIADRLEKKKVRLHGWWFDIAKADVYCYEAALHSFILIDREEAQVILERVK